MPYQGHTVIEQTILKQNISVGVYEELGPVLKYRDVMGFIKHI